MSGRSSDWVYSASSNVHATNHREWLTGPYKEFSGDLATFVYDQNMNRLEVLGMGTVELPIERPTTNGQRINGILRLRGVLHVPGAVCNVVSKSFLAQAHNVVAGTESTPEGPVATLVRNGDGVRIASLISRENCLSGLEFLKLSEPPVGPDFIEAKYDDLGACQLTTLFWPQSEQVKLHELLLQDVGDRKRDDEINTEKVASKAIDTTVGGIPAAKGVSEKTTHGSSNQKTEGPAEDITLPTARRVSKTAADDSGHKTVKGSTSETSPEEELDEQEPTGWLKIYRKRYGRLVWVDRGCSCPLSAGDSDT